MNNFLIVLSLVVFIAVIVVITWQIISATLRWLEYRKRVLSFYDLSEGEQDQYAKLCNLIDMRIGERFRNTLPLKIGAAILSGGTSLLWTGARQAYVLGKKANAIIAVKEYVELKRHLYNCKYVNWNTFPGAHIIIGGNPIDIASEKMKCPICKKFEMQQFIASSTREMLFCSGCSKTIVVKRSVFTGLREEMFIPGLCAAAIPIAGDLHDLALDLGDTLADVLGGLLDLIG